MSNFIGINEAHNTMVKTLNPMEVQKYLKDAQYPCSKEELLDLAAVNGADPVILETIQKIPMSRFKSPSDVTDGLNKVMGDIGEDEVADIA